MEIPKTITWRPERNDLDHDFLSLSTLVSKHCGELTPSPNKPETKSLGNSTMTSTSAINRYPEFGPVNTYQHKINLSLETGLAREIAGRFSIAVPSGYVSDQPLNLSIDVIPGHHISVVIENEDKSFTATLDQTSTPGKRYRRSGKIVFGDFSSTLALDELEQYIDEITQIIEDMIPAFSSQPDTPSTQM